MRSDSINERADRIPARRANIYYWWVVNFILGSVEADKDLRFSGFEVENGVEYLIPCQELRKRL